MNGPFLVGVNKGLLIFFSRSFDKPRVVKPLTACNWINYKLPACHVFNMLNAFGIMNFGIVLFSRLPYVTLPYGRNHLLFSNNSWWEQGAAYLALDISQIFGYAISVW